MVVNAPGANQASPAAKQPPSPQLQDRKPAAVKRANSSVAKAATQQSGADGPEKKKRARKETTQAKLFAAATEQAAGKRTRSQTTSAERAESSQKSKRSKSKANAAQTTKPPRGLDPNAALQRQDKMAIVNAIKKGKKILVAGYSSQGNGHTPRMYDPLVQAAKEGDVVVIAKPPHWQSDNGNEHDKLETYTGKLKEKKVNVIEVQADKTILGFYKDEGPSDNYQILREFAYKPNRDNSQVPAYGPEKDGPVSMVRGFSHHEIMKTVVKAANKNNVDKIHVFEDMDPYLAKAAISAGIPKDQVTGQSNHIVLNNGLFGIDDIRYPKFEGLSDAFLSKVNGNNANGKMSVVAFDPKINTTSRLAGSLEKLGYRETDSAIDARRKSIERLMSDRTVKYDPEMSAKNVKDGCVLCHPDAEKEDIDRGVYIYLNAYSKPIADQIHEIMTDDTKGSLEEKEAFKKTLFLFCGSATFHPPKDENGNIRKDAKGNDLKGPNAMHVAQAANFDAVVSAGFGTTSEMAYLLNREAYEGKFLVLPVEDQHEQVANANLLLPGTLTLEKMEESVRVVDNVEELKQKLKRLVSVEATTNQDLGVKTMKPLFDATNSSEGGTLIDRTAALITGDRPMDEFEKHLLSLNDRRAMSNEVKAARRLNKVMIPALEALAKGETSADVRFTSKVGNTSKTVAKWAEMLSNPEESGKMLGASFDNKRSRHLLNRAADKLRDLSEMPDGTETEIEAKQKAADDFMRNEYANKFFLLGY